MTGRIIMGAFLALLCSCGDDLGSRRAAVQDGQPTGGEMTIEKPSPRTSAADPVPGPQGDTEAGDSDEVVVDVMPESLVDSAEGFSTDPLDDTSGFDPTPVDPEGYFTDPIDSENFDN